MMQYLRARGSWMNTYRVEVEIQHCAGQLLSFDAQAFRKLSVLSLDTFFHRGKIPYLQNRAIIAPTTCVLTAD